jgi:hypothetical protein
MTPCLDRSHGKIAMRSAPAGAPRRACVNIVNLLESEHRRQLLWDRGPGWRERVLGPVTTIQGFVSPSRTARPHASTRHSSRSSAFTDSAYRDARSRLRLVVFGAPATGRGLP